MAAIPLVTDEFYYPDSDGEPVAETPVHFKEMVYVFEALDDRHGAAEAKVRRQAEERSRALEEELARLRRTLGES